MFLLIGKTSALTMNIAGVIKDWMLIFFSYSVFKAPVTATSLLGYVFCCSGVVVYNHMKLQAIKAKVASTSGKDEEKAKPTNGTAAEPHHERSKEDILSEIRRLQNEMTALEDRVQVSAKMMMGTGVAEAAKPDTTPTPAPMAMPASDKDK